MFIRRPIPSLNEKYLLYLPKDLQKDIKNKYNFFSYILTDDIYHNNVNIIRSKKSKKYKGKIKINKNSNNNNNSNNLFNNYMIKSKIEKKSKIINYVNKKINSDDRIYKPVKLKTDELFNNIDKKVNEKEKVKKVNEEEGDFYQKIKSNPFKAKKYSIF